MVNEIFNSTYPVIGSETMSPKKPTIGDYWEALTQDERWYLLRWSLPVQRDLTMATLPFVRIDTLDERGFFDWAVKRRHVKAHGIAEKFGRA